MSIKDTDFRTILKLFGVLDRKGKHISLLARESGITASHLYKKINAGDFNGLIATELKGRKRMVALTPKGELVKGLLEKVGGVLDV